SARSEARWMVGPSAIGSENGTPSSTMSAPPSTSAFISGRVSSGAGKPAVTKGISALRPSAWRRWKTVWILDMSRSHCGPHQRPASGSDSGSELEAGTLGDGVHVLVATPGEVDQQDLVLGQGG